MEHFRTTGIAHDRKTSGTLRERHPEVSQEINIEEWTSGAILRHWERAGLPATRTLVRLRKSRHARFYATSPSAVRAQMRPEYATRSELLWRRSSKLRDP